ncbi:MAG: biopolymer transporter ExbD [Nitrococcus sp.]|nr:biopolymer transporter ExbD [Nitrococcus sp.]
MRLRRRRSQAEISTHGIDLAPMLDFCINLLIFFIITAVFVHTSGLIVNRQTDVQQQEEKSKTIQVEINSNGEIWMGNRLIDVRAVRANVERMHATNPDAGVLIVAEGDAPTGVLVQVADQARQAGIYNISFATR